LRAHRVVIADLIADGEILAWQARQSTADLATAGFTGLRASYLRDLGRKNSLQAPEEASVSRASAPLHPG
jgi:hypothetical protein